MNKIQRVSNCAGATVLQEERCVKEIHQKYQDIGTAGLLLVQACVTWADKIGEAAFLALARQGRLPFGETRAHRLLTVGRREDILIAAQRGKLQDRYSVMYEAALIPKEDLAHPRRWSRPAIRSHAGVSAGTQRCGLAAGKRRPPQREAF